MKELSLAPRLMAILEQEYPRFSDVEFARRHKAIAEVMAKADLDHVVVSTDHRTGNVTQWVTGWPAIQEAYTVFGPSEPMTMFMEWWNHFALAKKLARGVEVHWGEHRVGRWPPEPSWAVISEWRPHGDSNPVQHV